MKNKESESVPHTKKAFSPLEFPITITHTIQSAPTIEKNSCTHFFHQPHEFAG